jgi:hypothetical protein
MLVIKKEGNNPDNDIDNNLARNKKTRRENHAYNVMLYILKNFLDLSVEDQCVVFNKMTFLGMGKESFLKLRTRVLADYNNKVDQESVTITDLKAGYHLGNGMLEMHFDSIEEINDQLSFYQDEFVKEKEKAYPDIDKLTKISLVVERLINRRSVLNVGTPIILFFRYQQQKQKLEMQQLKEKYAQKSLDKIEIPNKEPPPSKKEIALEKKDIQETTTNVTSNNIDELEHRAKLKDFTTRTSRGNTNRQDNTTTDAELRVQSATNDSEQTVSGGQDPSSEDTGSGDERRTKEALF